MRLPGNILARLFGKTDAFPQTSLYRIYTREFDTVVTGEILARQLAAENTETRTAVDEAWSAFCEGLQGWRTRNQIQALDTATALRTESSDRERADTIVTFLIDHSGSMRGQKILMAAAAVDIAQDFLGQLTCRTEILGFTTQSWKGGHSRRKWIRRGRPTHPGRLCDLLHIVYKTADDNRTSTGNPLLKPMLWPFRAEGKRRWRSRALGGSPPARPAGKS